MNITPGIRTVADFYTESQPYITLFNTFITKHALMGQAAVDHINYKCDSAETFEHIRALFEYDSEYIYQSIISNRRIALIKLRRSIPTGLGPIALLELSDQKPDHSQTNKFEHIEAYPLAKTYEDFLQLFATTETLIPHARVHHSTQDIDMGNGFLFRCTTGPLIEKIKTGEMV
ncbi:MAG: VOC family protein [Candidatus Doudnabacteria bacterium]|nr:VOC family protein [Candidatus Doudnabacteria bacterium]